MQVLDSETSALNTVYGERKSFKTKAAQSGIPEGWLEVPAVTGQEDYLGAFYLNDGSSVSDRNYCYNYSYTYYASLWTAYTLTLAQKTGDASTSTWRYNPNIGKSYQVDMTGSSYPTMYGASNYSKGHQCPSADRKSDETMNKQTYYCTNQTPQIQNGFNGSIWSALENAERNLVSKSSDVVYVVTGPAYQTIGGNETITYLNAASGKNAYPDKVPVPNYYWKAFLKVKWSGNQVASASAIGFWLEHKQYSNSNYSEYAVSVNYIERMTGFDLFANLPDALEDGSDGISGAEANTNWQTFQNF